MRKVCFHIVKAAHCGGKSTNDMELYPVGLLFFFREDYKLAKCADGLG